VPKFGGLIGLGAAELDAVVLGMLEEGFGEKGLAAVDVGFGEKGLAVVDVGLDAKGLLEDTAGGAEPVEVRDVGEAGTGKLANGLNRGASSFETSGKDFCFFSGLAFVGLLAFLGLPRMFLKMFDVLEPLVVPFNLGSKRLDSRSSLSSSSFVN
jgi:hypothetical protein